MLSVVAQHLSRGSNVAMRSTVMAFSIASNRSYRPIAQRVGRPKLIHFGWQLIPPSRIRCGEPR
jgi:hypothetical protein